MTTGTNPAYEYEPPPGPVDALTASEEDVLTVFRYMVRRGWELEEARRAIIRETKSARDHVKHAQWLLSAPTAEEIAAEPVTTSAIESESESEPQS